jgi:hypothetical protein
MMTLQAAMLHSWGLLGGPGLGLMVTVALFITIGIFFHLNTLPMALSVIAAWILTSFFTFLFHSWNLLNGIGFGLMFVAAAGLTLFFSDF